MPGAWLGFATTTMVEDEAAFAHKAPCSCNRDGRLPFCDTLQHIGLKVRNIRIERTGSRFANHGVSYIVIWAAISRPTFGAADCDLARALANASAVIARTSGAPGEVAKSLIHNADIESGTCRSQRHPNVRIPLIRALISCH